VELPRAVRTGRQEDEMSNSAFVAQNPFGLGIGWQVKIGNVPIDVEIGPKSQTLQYW
jgi:hypothetical protein